MTSSEVPEATAVAHKGLKRKVSARVDRKKVSVPLRRWLARICRVIRAR